MRYQFWEARLWALDNKVNLTTILEPFEKGLFSHGSESAYPPDRSRAIFPSNLSIQWSNSSLDETMADGLRQIAHAITLLPLRMVRIYRTQQCIRITRFMARR
jgi:hypothetical protein